MTEPEKVELAPDTVKIQSGEVVDASGHAQPALWLEGEGRRMHGNDERVLVFMFFSPEEAEARAIEIIKECAVLDLSRRLPMIHEGEVPGT